MSGRLIRRQEVLKKTGHKSTSLDRAIQDCGFPKPIRIGKRAVAWVEEEVDAWIKRRIQESREDAKERSE